MRYPTIYYIAGNDLYLYNSLAARLPICKASARYDLFAHLLATLVDITRDFARQILWLFIGERR
jgi:hypothetical protein